MGCLSFFLVLAVLACLAWLARVPILTFAGQMLVEDDGPQRADVILVLGGDEFGARIVKAAQLQEAGYAPYVLVSGPKTLLGHESDESIEYARRRGHPVTIFKPLVNESDSTRSEAKAVHAYMREHAVKTVLLVTSNYHTRRAARLMRKEMTGIHVVVVPAPDPFFRPRSWWTSRSGEKTFLYEWLKTLAVDLGV